MEKTDKVELKINDSRMSEKKITRKSSLFEGMSYLLLLSVVFLLPLFFIPSKFAFIDFSKILMVALGTLAALVFWSVSRLKDGKFEFAGSLLFPSSFFVVFIYFLSSIFSGNRINSLIGNGSEVSTFALVLIGFLLMFLVSSLFRSKDKIFYSYVALLISFLIVFLFQGFRLLFGPEFLSFGLFSDATANLVGKWNDLGIYFGLIALLSVITLELATLGKLMRFFLYFSSFASLFFLSLVNFKIIWFVIGIFSFIFFIYSISLRKKTSVQESAGDNSENSISIAKRKPYLALFFLIISAAFIVDGFRSKHFMGDSIADYFKISQIEVRPSLQGTFEILSQSVKKNPILGSGPNSFLNNWLLFKPEGVNRTVFWNIDFNYGVGILPTFAATTGILGIISWLIFLGLFLYVGFKYIFVKINNQFSRYLVVSSFLASLYLWTFDIFYIPGASMFFMTFIFTGIFIAAFWNENLFSTKSFSYSGNPRSKFIAVIMLVILSLSSVTGGYIYIQKFLASLYFQKALYSANASGNIDEALGYANKALSFSKTDSSYRLLSDIYLAKLNLLTSQKNISSEALNNQFQLLFQNAAKNAKTAVEIDGADYQNYLAAGRVYEAVMPIEGAYKMAADNYKEALKLNPKSPLINLIIGRLEASNKNNAKAKEFIVKAIQLKDNYTEAAFLLAQIEVAEGNIKNAIKLVEAASTLTFDNPVAYFQLGILKYSDKERDYKGAAEAFEKAVALNQSYSNARYFLGLSYYNLGRTAEAIKQFEVVREFNPDSEEVKLILNNLRAGRASFSNATPPVDDKPEKRKSLPVKDDEKKFD